MWLVAFCIGQHRLWKIYMISEIVLDIVGLDATDFIVCGYPILYLAIPLLMGI